MLLKRKDLFPQGPQKLPKTRQALQTHYRFVVIDAALDILQLQNPSPDSIERIVCYLRKMIRTDVPAEDCLERLKNSFGSLCDAATDGERKALRNRFIGIVLTLLACCDDLKTTSFEERAALRGDRELFSCVCEGIGRDETTVVLECFEKIIFSESPVKVANIIVFGNTPTFCPNVPIVCELAREIAGTRALVERGFTAWKVTKFMDPSSLLLVDPLLWFSREVTKRGVVRSPSSDGYFDYELEQLLTRNSEKLFLVETMIGFLQFNSDVIGLLRRSLLETTLLENPNDLRVLSLLFTAKNNNFEARTTQML